MTMTAKLERTDPHRPGAIIPSDYTFQCWYVLPGSDPDSGCTEMLHEFRKTNPKWFEHPSWGSFSGKCSICGANFRTGEVWIHRPTGEALHIGHDCAQKYEMLNAYAEREIAAWHRDETKRRAIAIKERKHAKEREARRVEHADLFTRLEALKANEQASNFARDFAGQQIHNIDRKGWLPSEKQLALLTKLETETVERANRPVEVKIPAPTGRVTLTGQVVSVKEHESDFGITLKMTVKVTTPEGIWLAWMTVPNSPFFQYCGGNSPFYNAHELKGHEITVKATLKPGSEPHFVFGKRPMLIAINGKKYEAPAPTPIEQAPGEWEISVSIDRNPSTPVYRSWARRTELAAAPWQECGTEFTSEAALARAAEYVTARGGVVKA